MALTRPAYFVERLSCERINKRNVLWTGADVLAWVRLWIVFAGTWAIVYHCAGALLILLPAGMTFDDNNGKPYSAAWLIKLTAGMFTAMFLWQRIELVAAALAQQQDRNP